MTRLPAILLLLVMLLLPVGVQAQLLYFCHMEGEVHASCCCESVESEHSDRTFTGLSSDDQKCCELQTATVDQPVTNKWTAPALAVAVLPEQDPEWSDEVVPLREMMRGPVGARAPPVSSVPRFLRHCSFLI